MDKVVKMSVAVCLLSMLSFCNACTFLNKKAGLKDDNIIEESIEAVIQSQTGISVDLSPDSPEK